jgi:hypothetical protein
MATVTATVDQRQHRTPHLMNMQLVVGAMSRTDAPILSPTQVAAVVAIVRERRELKERIAALAAQLKSDERQMRSAQGVRCGRRLIAHKAVRSVTPRACYRLPEPSSARVQASIHSLAVRFMSKSSLSRLSKSGMWAAP